MSTIDWQRYDKDLLALLDREDVNSYVEMCDILSKKYPYERFTYDAVQGRVYRLKHTNMASAKPPSGLPYINKYFDYLVGSVAPEPKKARYPRKRRIKTLYASDLHFPFEDEKAIDAALAPNLDADLLVTSELMDCYSLNSFSKKISVPLELEMDKTLRFFEYVNENFPTTYVVASNHEQRIVRTVGRRLPNSLIFLCNTDLLGVLARPFPHVITIPEWWYQIGDVIYTHAPNYSKIDLKAGWNVYQYFQEWGDALNIKPFSVIVQGHTHHLGSFYRPTKKIIEGGCLCELMEWTKSRFQSKPWTQGYVIIIQEDGKAILDLCREYQIQ